MLKKIFLFVFILLLSFNSAKAISFSEALNSSKPIVLFLYADWINNKEQSLNSFKQMYNLDSRYNFVTLNIADKDMKTFNEKFSLSQRLPYVLLIRNNGKVTRIISKSCMNDRACMKDKLYLFTN